MQLRIRGLLGIPAAWQWVVVLQLICAVTTIEAATVVITNSVRGEGVILGTGVFTTGEKATLRAVPRVDWKFDHWESVPQANSQTNPITIEIAHQNQPKAVFSPARRLSKGSIWGGLTPVPESVLEQCRDMSVGHEHMLIVESDGRVSAWGGNGAGQSAVPGGLVDTVQVSAGYQHSLALSSEGTVRAWGWNSRGQIDVPVFATNLIAVSAGGQHSLGLRPDGTVIGWGNQTDGESKPPSDLGRAIQIAAGNGFSVVLREDGTVRSWGYNANGESTVPQGLKDVVQISACWSHTLALKRDGSVAA